MTAVKMFRWLARRPKPRIRLVIVWTTWSRSPLRNVNVCDTCCHGNAITTRARRRSMAVVNWGQAAINSCTSCKCPPKSTPLTRSSYSGWERGTGCCTVKSPKKYIFLCIIIGGKTKGVSISLWFSSLKSPQAMLRCGAQLGEKRSWNQWGIRNQIYVFILI